MTHEDIQRLQSVGRTAQEERRQFILRDDSGAAWGQIRNLKCARMDIVLDNGTFLHRDVFFVCL